MQIDPRGPRFGAIITTVVLGLVLLIGPGGWPLLALQTLAFAAGAILGLSYQPYGIVYRAVIQPRLGPPSATEDSRPPRFAQAVGLVFAGAGLLGALLGMDVLFYVAVGLAFFAAFLNAAFNFCLGCEMYLRFQRLRGGAAN